MNMRQFIPILLAAGVFASGRAAAQTVQLRTVSLSAGAARLGNGSIVNLGQPLVGRFGSPQAGISGNAGFLNAPATGIEQPASPRIQPLAFAFTGAVRLAFGAEIGWTYSIEASTNLVNWLPLWSARPEAGTVTFEDLDAVKFGLRFYRISVQ